jgi:hypothetical protein
MGDAPIVCSYGKIAISTARFCCLSSLWALGKKLLLKRYIGKFTKPMVSLMLQ